MYFYLNCLHAFRHNLTKKSYLLHVQSRACTATLHMWSKVCMAPFHVRIKVSKSALQCRLCSAHGGEPWRLFSAHGVEKYLQGPKIANMAISATFQT